MLEPFTWCSAGAGLGRSSVASAAPASCPDPGDPAACLLPWYLCCQTLEDHCEDTLSKNLPFPSIHHFFFFPLCCVNLKFGQFADRVQGWMKPVTWATGSWLCCSLSVHPVSLRWSPLKPGEHQTFFRSLVSIRIEVLVAVR